MGFSCDTLYPKSIVSSSAFVAQRRAFEKAVCSTHFGLNLIPSATLEMLDHVHTPFFLKLSSSIHVFST